MKLNTTNRGFKVLEFKDRYGAGCSLQESSLATDYAIWFGVNDANPLVLIPGKGWQKVPFPEDTIFSTRMHLTQKDIKKLMPYLRYFLKYGCLPNKELKVRERTKKQKSLKLSLEDLSHLNREK